MDEMDDSQDDVGASDAERPLLKKSDSDEDMRFHFNDRLESTCSVLSTYATVEPVNSKYISGFMLLNYMIGSGILNQAYVVMKCGIFGAIAGYIIVAYMTWTGVMFLTDAAFAVDKYDYSAIAKHVFGMKGERFIDFSIFIATFGGLISYILVIGSTVDDLLLNWGCHNDLFCNPDTVTVLAVTLFVAPLCLYKTFAHLGVVSVFSVATIWSVLLLVVFAGPMYAVRGGSENNVELFSASGSFASMGSMIGALSICPGNMPAFNTTEHKSRNPKTWSWVSGSVVVIGAAMLALMGFCGYYAFRSETEGVVLDNFHAPGYDVFKVFLAMHLICYLPAAFMVMRYSVIKLCLDKISEELPSNEHTVLSLGMIVIITAIVLLLRSTGLSSGVAFSVVVNISGGIGGTLTSFIIPTAIYLKLTEGMLGDTTTPNTYLIGKEDENIASLGNTPEKLYWRRWEAYIIHYVSIVIMVLVVVMTLLDVV